MVLEISSYFAKAARARIIHSNKLEFVFPVLYSKVAAVHGAVIATVTGIPQYFPT